MENSKRNLVEQLAVARNREKLFMQAATAIMNGFLSSWVLQKDGSEQAVDTFFGITVVRIVGMCGKTKFISNVFKS